MLPPQPAKLPVQILQPFGGDHLLIAVDDFAAQFGRQDFVDVFARSVETQELDDMRACQPDVVAQLAGGLADDIEEREVGQKVRNLERIDVLSAR